MDINLTVENKLLDFPCEFVEIDSINPFVSKVKIKVCYVSDEPNRNGTIINKEIGQQMAQTLPGCPIVGHYINAKEDFGAHDRIFSNENGDWVLSDNTRPYGFVDINPKVWFQMEKDKNGLEHEYLFTEGFIWTGQYEEAQRIIEQGNGQSMELDGNLSEGEWNFDEKSGMGFFIFNKAILSKLCILGNDVEPCFEDASITSMNFSLGNSFKNKFYALMTKIQDALDEGGNKLDIKDTNVPAGQQPAEPIAEPAATPVVAQPDENLSAMITKLSAENDALKEEIETLKGEYSKIQTQRDELLEFKNKAEKKDKQAMIDSFSMLSDNDKLDVISHMDEYSLDDIEAKLSVICVRKRVDFSAIKEPVQEPVVHVEKPDVFMYNLNGMNYSPEPSIPDWLKAADEIAKEIE